MTPEPSSAAVRFLDEAAIQEVLRMEDLISAMQQALVDFSAGRVRQPVRSIVPVPEHHGLMGMMPAVYGDIMGSKLVNVFPRNLERALPSHQAVIVVFSSQTGVPLALMDGRLITEMRTAAVSAVATRLLASPGARSLAILGSGVQARAHLQALSLVRKFDEVRVWSRNSGNARQFASECGATVTSLEEAVRAADVIVTVTNSPQPLVKGEWLKPGTFIAAVGAVGPTRRELDSATMHDSAVIVDSREAAAVEAGDVLLAEATIYAELGELLAGTKPLPDARTTVFKSLGIAAEDLAAARLVLGSPAGTS